jgi:hypothetical protein
MDAKRTLSADRAEISNKKRLNKKTRTKRGGAFDRKDVPLGFANAVNMPRT